ncbi:hypothetical protein O181_057468 [Austropuccinia psidii MF-1]|uniref:Uncharacterized protein n=1 Tax=Austropuccinia psidii MF-1 TaxID=1389203 RepID=A0A9Q3EF22_9BASI|nr:hypothetical protein [Austropuccinia psidii MF-1]
MPWTVAEMSDEQSDQPTENLVLSAVEPKLFPQPAETAEQNPTHTNDLLEEMVFEEIDTFPTQTEEENIRNSEHLVDQQLTSTNDRTLRLKVIGPCHPNLILSKYYHT